VAEYHLAQLNIAKAKGAMESPVMQGFVDRLDEINALADQAPGFIWRLQTEEGNATAIQAFDDPMLLVNISVWESVDALKHYVYRSLHLELLKERDQWFHKMADSHQVLWWLPAGHIPTVAEAKQRLESLRRIGPSEFAFTFARPFPNPDQKL
jgi:hypothetical protein